MKEYSCIAFDLDGTLTDPSAGLLSGFVYAFKKLGIDYGERESLKRFIGPPLFLEWQKEFGFTPEESDYAVRLFREYYLIYGWWDNRIYDGVAQMLKRLKDGGKTLIVATSKPEDTAKKVLKLFGIDNYFDFIGGADGHKNRDRKCEVLEYSLASAGITDKSTAILVGDRSFDAEGAAIVGIDSMGILWGHGSEQEIESSNFTLVARTPDQVADMLLQKP